MTRVYLESSPIFKVVTPAIDKGIRKLDQALSILNNTSVPDGYSGSLNSKRDRINQIKRELYNVQDNLRSATQQINNVELDKNDKADMLPKSEIPVRAEIVK